MNEKEKDTQFKNKLSEALTMPNLELKVTGLILLFDKVIKEKDPKKIVKVGKELLEYLDEDINERIIGAGVTLDIAEKNLSIERDFDEEDEEKKLYASIVDEGLSRTEESIERLKYLLKKRKEAERVVRKVERFLRKEFEIREKEKK